MLVPKLQRMASRALSGAEMTARGRSGLLDRCREQFAYGHVDILRSYVGASANNFLTGRLPHDEWGLPIVESVGGAFRGPNGRELPTWTWNSAWRDGHRARGATKVFAIGAPWLYLLQIAGVEAIWDASSRCGGIRRTPGPDERRVLYVPLHSWERETLDLGSRARDLSDVLDPAGTTVLLGWGDFLSRGTRNAYESAGFRVECNGYRGGAVAPESPIGDRQLFLWNLLDLLRTSHLVVSEEVCTALIYAASAGIRVQVMPELAEIARLNEVNFSSNLRTVEEFARHLTEVNRRYGWMYDASSDPHDHRTQISATLGGDFLMSPDDLMRILRWYST